MRSAFDGVDGSFTGTRVDSRAGAISTGLNWKLGAILNVIEPHDPSPIRALPCRPHGDQR
jgi:hypothetical protein